ncbi:MAG: protein translocase subunit SecF [Microbacteriaceae bacterium]
MAGLNLTQFGNDLYTGERSINFIGLRRRWLTIASVLILICIALPFVRGAGNPAEGFNFGIEFRGGSQFQVAGAATDDTILAQDAVRTVIPEAEVRTTVVGTDGIRVQTDELTEPQSREVAAALGDAYSSDNVDFSIIGAAWGADITQNAIRGLLVFMLLASIVMALYFRTWKMSAAAVLSLVGVLVLTTGVYGATGLEVTPGAIIGFLTILAYSLYDTVVVFDKVRENTAAMTDDSPRTFAETVNLGVNQTLVRSINTSVVSVLPVAAILFIGTTVLGADTLRDISLALLVGTVTGTAATLFMAAPLYAWFREGEPEIARRDKAILERREAVRSDA